ncbi:MAG: hypothetical protein KDA96_13735 [Planctomycetaceae bacterium]|nr:hypothetical protein [Planctomycetaceae bacterium]
MKRAFAITAALMLTLVTFSSADAADRCPQCGRVHSSPTYTYSAPTASNGNVFQQLWQLEQRKNAWLRRTFLQ